MSELTGHRPAALGGTESRRTGARLARPIARVWTHPLAGRLRLYLLALWAAVSLNFLIPRLMPGSPSDALIAQIRAQQPDIPDRQVELIRAQFGGSDAPLFQQYLEYLGQVVRLDFGASASNYPVPVADVLAEALPWTLFLVGVSTVLAFVLGVLAGVVIGWRAGGPLDLSVSSIAMTISSLPYFWMALGALSIFGLTLGWFPITGSVNTDLIEGFNVQYILSVLYYGLLPMTTIVVASFGGWLLGMRNMMVTTLGEDYILLARAKGLSRRRIMTMYAARNAVLPSLTNFAFAIGSVVAGSLLTETVFNYPGLGSLLLTSINNRDYPVMQALFLLVTVGVLLANFVIDSLYTRLDPRAESIERS